MGRGRHKSSRGRGSDPEWPGEYAGSGQYDDRGTQEWLSEGDGPDRLDQRGTQEWLSEGDGPDRLDQRGTPESPEEGHGAPDPVRLPTAWDPGPPAPAWPNAWEEL